MIEFLHQTWEWIKDINWVIALLAAIPLSITANLLTPVARNFLARRSQVRRTGRIEELRAELTRIQEYKKDPASFYNATFVSLFRVLIFLALGGFMSSAIFFLGAPIYLIAVMEAWRHIRIMTNLRDLDHYSEEMAESIRAMEALEADHKTDNA